MSTPYMTTARPIRMTDIPEEYRDIAEAIGLEAFTQLTLLCGGQSLYIPKRESLERGARDRDIRARFDGGNYRALAVQFRLSERQIRKIINGTRSYLGQTGSPYLTTLLQSNFLFHFSSIYAILILNNYLFSRKGGTPPWPSFPSLLSS